MTPTRVEQIFLKRAGSGTEVLLVLEDEAGGRTRERLPLPLADLGEAAVAAARQLSARGIGPAKKPRLRVERSDGLADDSELLERFLTALGQA